MQDILEVEGKMTDLADKWCSLDKIGRLWKFKLTEVDEWVKSGKSAL